MKLLHLFKKFSILLFVLFFFTSFVYADTTYIFSTDPQSVSVGQMSGKINIQASGPVTETTYLSVTSSSVTGQMLTSTGNLLTSSYISTGDSNRAVYYKDSTAGDFILTADILSKDKVKIATITQHIFIGQPVSGSSGTTTQTTATTTSGTSLSSSGTTSSAASSAHSSPTALSTGKDIEGFEISAGRDRLTSVGNTMLFEAGVSRGKDNVVEKIVGYFWSFGDGTTGTGDMLTHIYKFPGDYVVICNASFSDMKAVDRVQVKVIDPQIVISRVDGGLVVTNNGSTEINLEGWSVTGGSKKFVFPKDTLISAGKKITVADEVTGINMGSVEIQNPMARVYSRIIDVPPAPATVPVSTTTELNSIPLPETPIVLISQASVHVTSSRKIASVQKQIVTSTKKVLPTKKSTQTAAVVTVFEAPTTTPVVSSVVFWSFTFVRHLFGGK